VVKVALGEQKSDEIRRQTLAYLEGHTVMTLATVGPEGLWAAAVFYVNDNFDLIFLSAGHTRHGQNLAANPQAAATIQENYEDWPQIQGIQLAGSIRLLSDEPQKAAISLYMEKYPFIKSAGPMVRAALQKVNWYRLQPQQLYFIDNSKGFGHRDRVELLTT
jgi:uncharacterized protein YhbP (UPF0306 family)